MLILESCYSFSHPFSHKNSIKKHGIYPLFAKRNQIPEIPKSKSRPRLVFQVALLGVFSLGFIDAGYSGDWSRIGAISRETEDLLKAAAFVIVPLCLFLIFTLFNEDKV